MHGSPGWIRTSDTWINSPLRYHCATGESARNIVAEPRAFAKWCFLRTYNCMAAGYGRLRKVRVTGGMSRLRTQTSGFAHPGPQRVHKRVICGPGGGACGPKSGPGDRCTHFLRPEQRRCVVLSAKRGVGAWFDAHRRPPMPVKRAYETSEPAFYKYCLNLDTWCRYASSAHILCAAVSGA